MLSVASNEMKSQPKKIFPDAKSYLSQDDILDAVPIKQTVAPNPLKLFPAKNDNFTKAFFGVDAPKHARELEDKTKWLKPDKLDPSFGINGSSQEVLVRRSYRRMNSCGLFAPPKQEQAPLSELNNFRDLTKKNFVLVEESRLAELTKFENMLRDEKEKLGEQCSWVLNDFHVDPRIPLPATRLAVHNICESEMRKLADEIHRMNQTWTKYAKDNHYNRTHIFVKESYIDKAPLGQRAMKLKLVREAAEDWRIRRDRDTMQYEDDLSYLIGKYADAQNRKRDYDRYFVLATRYGVFSQKEYELDANPGKRYYLKVLKGALRFQKLWCRYWAVARVRRFVSARRIQCRWRLFIARKKIYPIIKIRLKAGRRSYYRFCWSLWLQYNRICRRIKEAIIYHKGNYVKICFDAWKKRAKAEVDRKNQIRYRFVQRVRNAKIAGLFMAWVSYTERRKYIKTTFRRNFQLPEFDIWVRYTEWSKMMKKLHRASTKIAAVGRCFLMKKLYKKKRRAMNVLYYFGLIVLSGKLARIRREAIITNDFKEWEPEEIERRIARANENERRRLQKVQQAMQDRENKALTELKKHFQSISGRVQIRELRQEEWSHSTNWREKFLSKSEWNSKAQKILIDRCSEVNRGIEQHDFNAKFPPLLCCAIPTCRTIFTTENQYLRHETVMENDSKHSDYCHRSASMLILSKSPLKSYVKFHLLLCHGRGYDSLKTYICRWDGLGEYSSTLEAWQAIQDWKKLPYPDKNFASRTIAIYETFFRSDASRPTMLKFDNLASTLQQLEDFRNRDFDGFFHKTRAKKSLLRSLLMMQGQPYQEWSEKGVLSSKIFDEIEWECFMKLYLIIARDDAFVESEDYRKYLEVLEIEKVQRREALLNDYRELRMNTIRQWTQEFMKVERMMSQRAYFAVDQWMEDEVDRMVSKSMLAVANEITRDIRFQEQSVHEKAMLVVDDAVYCAESNVLDDIYEYYTKSLIKTMWDRQECRKGMLEYAGLLKPQLKKKLLIDMNARNETREWFDEFFKKSKEEEQSSMPLTTIQAATRIQKRVRGMLGRITARKRFAVTFVKRFDADSQAYYYANMATNESSWNRPRIMKHLYPKSTW